MSEVAYSNSSDSYSQPLVPTLSSPRLLFQAIKSSDIPDIFQMASDIETVQWLSWEQHSSPIETAQFVKGIEGCISLKPGQTFLTWTLHEKSEEASFIGLIHFSQFNDIAGQLDFVITKNQWNKGFGSEAIGRLCEWLFQNDPHLLRLQCHCVAEHFASRKVMEKCGFQFEGIRRDGIKMKNNVFDLAIYSLIRSDLR